MSSWYQVWLRQTRIYCNDRGWYRLPSKRCARLLQTFCFSSLQLQFNGLGEGAGKVPHGPRCTHPHLSTYSMTDAYEKITVLVLRTWSVRRKLQYSNCSVLRNQLCFLLFFLLKWLLDALTKQICQQLTGIVRALAPRTNVQQHTCGFRGMCRCLKGNYHLSSEHITFNLLKLY